MLFVLNPHRSKSCETLRLNSAYPALKSPPLETHRSYTLHYKNLLPYHWNTICRQVVKLQSFSNQIGLGLIMWRKKKVYEYYFINP